MEEYLLYDFGVRVHEVNRERQIMNLRMRMKWVRLISSSIIFGFNYTELSVERSVRYFL